MWVEVVLAVLNVLQLALLIGLRFFQDRIVEEVQDVRYAVLNGERNSRRGPTTLG